MDCPECAPIHLLPRGVKDQRVVVDLCPSCRGVWFEAGELAAVLGVAAKGLEAPPDATQGSRLCPACGKPLFGFAYPQTMVRVDMCRKCGGLWLDAGEYRDIKDARELLKRCGEMEEYAPVPGLKGSLIRLINTAIAALNSW